MRKQGANTNNLYDSLDIEVPNEIIDFSTNTNVLHFDVDYNLDIKEVVSTYPDDESIELSNLISKQNNLSKENILMGNGSNELIYLIASFYQNKNVGILEPTYSEYKRALDGYNANIKSFNDIKEIKDVSLVFICNPNNPTGHYYKKSEIINILEKNIDVLLDEAYIDFLNEEIYSFDLNKYPNLYIIRSLTKVYHLSGIRLGYLMSNSLNIQKIKKRQPTWSVNSVAQTLGLRFLKNKEIITKTKDFYKTETNYLINEIKSIGYNVLDTSVNFFLVEVPSDLEIIKFLLKKGIVVRHSQNYLSIEGNYIRIATKTRKENDLLIKYLEEYNNEHISI